MTNSHLSRKRVWLGLAACAGLAAVPLAALADASGEISTAAKHAGMSAQATSLEMAHAHLHHTLNCLVGPKGRGFDSKAENPCGDLGNGAIADTSDAAAKKSLEKAAGQARSALRSKDLDKVKEDAAKIQSELGEVK
jgi:hypothetical protein